MFPATEASIAPPASPQPVAPNRASAPTSVGVVQREPASATPAPAVTPPGPGPPPTALTPSQSAAPPEALPSRPEGLVSSDSEPSQVPAPPTTVAEVRQPGEIEYRDTSVTPAEPAHPMPAEVRAREGESAPVLPRFVEPSEPQLTALNQASVVMPPPAAQIVEVEASPGPSRPAEMRQGGSVADEPGPADVVQAPPPPPSVPAPVVPTVLPQVALSVEAPQPAPRPVEVRIGRIEVRVNSPAPAPPVVPAPESAPAQPVEGTGFEGYDAIRGYRIPTGW